MAKQITTKRPTTTKKTTSKPVAAILTPAISPIRSFRYQSIAIILIGFIIYFNSFNNKYALDDDIVMRLNEYVQQGFAGIGKIMTTDSYDSFFKSMGSEGELQGGRYRPLSIVTFAIEQQLFGKCYGIRYSEVGDSLRAMQKGIIPGNGLIMNRLIAEKTDLEEKISETHLDIAMIRHIVSVLLYILSAVVLLWLLREYIFKYAEVKFINPNDIAFFTTLLFLIHPIHTEVVANVKSRDEILSFLFIVTTFIFVFKNEEKKNTKALLLGLFFFLLALLSKEWGITLVALIPMAFYIFKKYTIGKSLKRSLPYFLIAVFYLILRYKFVGPGKQGAITEVLNNPFVFATPVQKLATEIFILLKYLRLLIFPHPLSADYSWKTIPYNSFSDAVVWISILVHLSIIFLFFKLLKKRNWAAFAIAFYISHLFLVSNLVMPIGATMGERLIYHSSLGFVMIAAFGLLFLLKRFSSIQQNNVQTVLYTSLLFIFTVPMSYGVIKRNPNWETDNILFMHDAWIVPNSVLANGNSGKAFIELAQKDTANRQVLLDSAIYHLEKALSFHPKYVNGYLNIGLAWFQKHDLDKTEYYWNMARKYFPDHPFFRNSYDPALANALVETAKEVGKKGDLTKAIELLSRSLKYDSTNANTWYHYGGANFAAGNVNEAYRAWSKCLQIAPNHPEAKAGMQAVLTRMREQQTTNNQKK